MALIDLRSIPADKLAMARALILQHTDRFFRRSRTLRRWTAVLTQPSDSELSIRCICQRFSVALRPDNIASSFIKHYRFASGGRVTGLQKAKWVDTGAAGYAFADFKPMHEGYSVLVAGLLHDAKQQDAAATVINNTTTPPLPPQVPAAVAASPLQGAPAVPPWPSSLNPPRRTSKREGQQVGSAAS